MALKYFTALLILPLGLGVNAQDGFEFLGGFDNVQASQTGHCQGISVLIWASRAQQVVGLLSVESGLCGDPPCAIFQGTIGNNNISFETSAPIYDQRYRFTGEITPTALSGSLNGEQTVLGSNSFSLPSASKTEWCSFWSRIPRCQGVMEYCR